MLWHGDNLGDNLSIYATDMPLFSLGIVHFDHFGVVGLTF